VFGTERSSLWLASRKEFLMIRFPTFALLVSGLTVAVTPLHAQDLSRYREFTLASSVASVANASASAPAEATVVRERPSLIRELRWRPQRYSGASAASDPVREVVFSFYEDKLFQIEVEYDRQRTEGLTDADLVESMAAVYGPPVLVSTDLRPEPSLTTPDRDVVVARWADPDSSVTLLRGTYPTSLRLVLVRPSLAAQARTASVDAIRKDSEDAPQREIARQKQAAEDRRLAAEKARATNKPAFKP
jgi:hypothetical protein